MRKTFIELFAGVGGFRVGLNHIDSLDTNGHAVEKGDWQCLYMNQWEPSTKKQHAFECYTQRFENHGECSNQNISTIDPEKLPDASLLVGGFPCQDYSVAHSLKSEMGIEGKKGVLFWDIAKILEIKKTPFFLLENVDRLLISPSKQRGRDFAIICSALSRLGYDLEYRVINAADYGMPQKRRRVFIFGWHRSTKYATKTIKEPASCLFWKQFPSFTEVEYQTIKLHEDPQKYMDSSETVSFGNAGKVINGTLRAYRLKPIQEGSKPLKELLVPHCDDQALYLTEKQIQQFTYLKGKKKVERKRKDGSIWFYTEGACSFPDHLDLPSRTMLTSEGTVNRSTHVVEDLSNQKMRFLTPVEAERLQMFPDHWTEGMPARKRYFMMGNALVTGIVSRLEPKIGALIEDEN